MVGNAPLYRQVKADLGARIRAGEWGPHERIPSERELCAIHGLSRTTVRLAIDEAVREGLLYRVPGRGTFVAKGRRRIEQELLEVTAVERTLHARGLTPSIWVPAIRRRAADFALAPLSGAAPGSPGSSRRGAASPSSWCLLPTPRNHGVAVSPNAVPRISTTLWDFSILRSCPCSWCKLGLP